MPVATTRRLLWRLPAGYFSRTEPDLTEEFNVTNGSFETAGVSDDKAADWTRTTNAASTFEADPTTQGRLLITLGDDDPLTPIVRGSYSYVLGEKSNAKPDHTVAGGRFVQITSTHLWETKDFTHVAFRFWYKSEPDWTTVGIWRGELLVDGVVLWNVDLHSGQEMFNANQEVSLATVGAGFHAVTFRLISPAGSATNPIPTFLIDDVRLVRKTTNPKTGIWILLYGLALSYLSWHQSRELLKSLLRINETFQDDLDILMRDYGVPRPSTLAISDVQARDIWRLCLWESKVTRKCLTDAIVVLTGATPTFSLEGPSGGNPPTLTITLTGGALLDDPLVAASGLYFFG